MNIRRRDNQDWITVTCDLVNFRKQFHAEHGRPAYLEETATFLASAKILQRLEILGTAPCHGYKRALFERTADICVEKNKISDCVVEHMKAVSERNTESYLFRRGIIGKRVVYLIIG